jgi:hypothetical protein
MDVNRPEGDSRMDEATRNASALYQAWKSRKDIKLQPILYSMERREYRRRWMALKREREREWTVPSRVDLELPLDAQIRLVKGRPSDESWPQYLSALILKGLGGPASEPALKTHGGPSLNQPCRCGSGRKWKKCCGAAHPVPATGAEGARR